MEIKKEDAKSLKIKEKTVSTRAMDFVIMGSIALVFFLCPLFFTGLAAQGLGFEKLILFYLLVLIGIVSWVAKGVIAGELNLKRTPLDIPIAATIIVFAISTFFSISSKDSLIGSYGNSAKGLVAIVVGALFYYLVVNNINASRVKIIFISLISSSVLVIFYSLLQLNNIFLLPIAFTEQSSFNPIGGLSALTMYIVVMMPLLIIGASQMQSILPKIKKAGTMIIKIIIGLTIVCGLAVLALLNGFTFWPVAIVSSVILLMFFLAKIIKISSGNLFFPWGVFLILIIFLVIGNFNFFNQKLPAEVSITHPATWEIVKSSIKENPFFGSGPSTFYYSFAKYKSLNFNNTQLWNLRFDSGSNALFEIMASVGVLGALCVMILTLVALPMLFISLTKTQDKENNNILLGIFASFITVCLYSLLFSQNNSIILFFILISIFAVCSAVALYPEKFREFKLSFRSSAKYALALAAIFLCVSAGVIVFFTMGLKMYMADVYARKGAAEAIVDMKIEYLNKAVTLAPYQDIYYTNLSNNYIALANQEAVGDKNQTVIEENLRKAIETGKKAVDIAPKKAANNEALALIYENASFYTRGALEWAENLYNKVIELDPNNPAPYLRIALVNMARANAETDQAEKSYYIGEAVKKYDQAIAKKGDLAAAYYGKAIADEKLNNLDMAIEDLKKANLVSQDNLDYRFELGRMFFNRGVNQPKLDQNASAQITENDIKPDNGSSTESSAQEISVQPSKQVGGQAGRNSDLNAAEQIFLSIILANQNHANAKYSLAVLYQKIGEKENSRIMVNSLLEIIKDEPTRQAIQKQFADIL